MAHRSTTLASPRTPTGVAHPSDITNSVSFLSNDYPSDLNYTSTQRHSSALLHQRAKVMRSSRSNLKNDGGSVNGSFICGDSSPSLLFHSSPNGQSLSFQKEMGPQQPPGSRSPRHPSTQARMDVLDDMLPARTSRMADVPTVAPSSVPYNSTRQRSPDARSPQLISTPLPPMRSQFVQRQSGAGAVVRGGGVGDSAHLQPLHARAAPHVNSYARKADRRPPASWPAPEHSSTIHLPAFTDVPPPPPLRASTHRLPPPQTPTLTQQLPLSGRRRYSAPVRSIATDGNGPQQQLQRQRQQQQPRRRTTIDLLGAPPAGSPYTVPAYMKVDSPHARGAEVAHLQRNVNAYNSRSSAPSENTSVLSTGEQLHAKRPGPSQHVAEAPARLRMPSHKATSPAVPYSTSFDHIPPSSQPPQSNRQTSRSTTTTAQAVPQRGPQAASNLVSTGAQTSGLPRVSSGSQLSWSRIAKFFPDLPYMSMNDSDVVEALADKLAAATQQQRQRQQQRDQVTTGIKNVATIPPPYASTDEFVRSSATGQSRDDELVSLSIHTEHHIVSQTSTPTTPKGQRHVPIPGNPLQPHVSSGPGTVITRAGGKTPLSQELSLSTCPVSSHSTPRNSGVDFSSPAPRAPTTAVTQEHLEEVEVVAMAASDYHDDDEGSDGGDGDGDGDDDGKYHAATYNAVELAMLEAVAQLSMLEDQYVRMNEETGEEMEDRMHVVELNTRSRLCMDEETNTASSSTDDSNESNDEDVSDCILGGRSYVAKGCQFDVLPLLRYPTDAPPLPMLLASRRVFTNVCAAVWLCRFQSRRNVRETLSEAGWCVGTPLGSAQSADRLYLPSTHPVSRTANVSADKVRRNAATTNFLSQTPDLGVGHASSFLGRLDAFFAWCVRTWVDSNTGNSSGGEEDEEEDWRPGGGGHHHHSGPHPAAVRAAHKHGGHDIDLANVGTTTDTTQHHSSFGSDMRQMQQARRNQRGGVAKERAQVPPALIAGQLRRRPLSDASYVRARRFATACRHLRDDDNLRCLPEAVWKGGAARTLLTHTAGFLSECVAPGDSNLANSNAVLSSAEGTGEDDSSSSASTVPSPPVGRGGVSSGSGAGTATPVEDRARISWRLFLGSAPWSFEDDGDFAAPPPAASRLAYWLLSRSHTYNMTAGVTALFYSILTQQLPEATFFDSMIMLEKLRLSLVHCGGDRSRGDHHSGDEGLGSALSSVVATPHVISSVQQSGSYVRGYAQSTPLLSDTEDVARVGQNVSGSSRGGGGLATGPELRAIALQLRHFFHLKSLYALSVLYSALARDVVEMGLWDHHLPAPRDDDEDGDRDDTDPSDSAAEERRRGRVVGPSTWSPLSMSLGKQGRQSALRLVESAVQGMLEVARGRDVNDAELPDGDVTDALLSTRVPIEQLFAYRYLAEELQSDHEDSADKKGAGPWGRGTRLHASRHYGCKSSLVEVARLQYIGESVRYAMVMQEAILSAAGPSEGASNHHHYNNSNNGGGDDEDFYGSAALYPEDHHAEGEDGQELETTVERVLDALHRTDPQKPRQDVEEYLHHLLILYYERHSFDGVALDGGELLPKTREVASELSLLDWFGRESVDSSGVPLCSQVKVRVQDLAALCRRVHARQHGKSLSL